MPIVLLPPDILILVFNALPLLADIAALSQTCKSMHSMVEDFGWGTYLRSHQRPAFSVTKAQAQWSPRNRVRYNTLSDRAWSRISFVARPLSRPWKGKFQPVMAISLSRLIVAAGSELHSYIFSAVSLSEPHSPSIKFEGSVRLTSQPSAMYDITCLSFVDDGGLDRTLCAGYRGGEAERIILIPPDIETNRLLAVVRFPLASPRQVDGDFLESMKFSDSHLLSLSSLGVATLSTIPTVHELDSSTVSSINLQQRSWISYLSLHSSTPFAAFGTSSTTPLSIYPIQPEGICPTPSATMCMTTRHINGPKPSSAVYGITRAPPSSNWGSSDQILVSGWYDGQVRIYDLRADTRTVADPTHSGNSVQGPTPLAPVLAMFDPWSYEPIYDVSCGGGSGSHVAAGSARHSVVSFWDIRYPECGWSVHAPGNDSSPVYAVVLEGSRLFGATQSRPFIYDFGPDVNVDTYPSIPDTPVGVDGLKTRKGAGYQVTKYKHNRGLPDGY
ncbi:hypothetical protein ONZ45_g6010 [Pleurotus djamor]|nr:hypothetical protein ONZ45_g6010 [Pleurotus djamor]